MDDLRAPYESIYKSINLEHYQQYKDLRTLILAFEELKQAPLVLKGTPIKDEVSAQECEKAIVLTSFMREQLNQGRIVVKDKTTEEAKQALTDVEISWVHIYKQLQEEENI